MAETTTEATMIDPTRTYVPNALGLTHLNVHVFDPQSVHQPK